METSNDINATRFIKILETDSLTDIALIRSTLDAGAIKYFIQGEIMKYIRPGDQGAILFVFEDDVERTISLLKSMDLKFISSLINPAAK